MDAQAILDYIEDEYETELSRLGSSKAMYAETDGDMDSETVLGAMADRAIAAAVTFEEWAQSNDDPMADRYERTAASLREQAEGLAAHGETVDPSDRPTPLENYLRDLDRAAERFAGYVAWTEIIDRTLSQAVGFFIGNADTQSANLFRDIRSDVDGYLGDVNSKPSSTDSEMMEEIAGEAVQAAYQDYVQSLEAMGIKVKPVC